MHGAEACQHPGWLELTLRGLALCAFPARARIVDVGCGTGASVRMLRQQGYACVGLEQSPCAAGFPQLQGRAEALPFARESLHGILCECVLSLVRDPDRILKGFWEVCRPGGRLLLTDIYIKRPETPPSAALFSRQTLASALRDARWRVTHFEDCPQALKHFAAHLLWHAAADAAPWPQAASGAIPWSACGYGLWIAHKDERHESTAA